MKNEQRNGLSRALECIELINMYDKQYYELGASDITDAEYDRLYDEYLILENEFPELKNCIDAPTRKVGAGKEAGLSTALPKFIHKSPLLSIDRKAKELSELKDFYEKVGGDGIEVIIEPKLDGITCNINFENGLFVNAATRGNGTVGDVITDNFQNTDTKYPSVLKNRVDLELRGEAIIPFDYFQSNLIKEYSNPRNAVAGIMRQIDSKRVKGKGVQVMFYDIGKTSLSLADKDDVNVRQFIKDLGFQSVPVYRASSWESLKKIVETGMDGVIQEADGFNVMMDEDRLYPQAICDGLVIKVNSLKKRDEIGMSEKGPKWAFAYKFKPLQAETRIDHVEWQVGKTGRIVPVAVFDEVSLGGTKITRATLNNYDYMQKLPVNDHTLMKKTQGLQMDDCIIVERSNDVIPRVVSIAKRQDLFYQQDLTTSLQVGKRMESFHAPTSCPVCHGTVVQKGPLHSCMNPLCSAQLKGRLEHFVSRDAMNIIGFGEGVIDILVDKGFLKELSSIYQLSSQKEELKKIEGFGERKVENLIKSIEESKNPELWQFIYSLSIDGVGKKMSKDLSQRYHTLDNFLSATETELIVMEDVGEITVKSIMNFTKNPESMSLIEHLMNSGVNPKSVSMKGDRLKGKTFVITGTLQKPRSTYQEIIEENGGKISGSVSKKTYAVLIGADAGTKDAKARQLVAEGSNILLLDSEELIEEYLKK